MGMGLWAGRLCLFGKMRLIIRPQPGHACPLDHSSPDTSSQAPSDSQEPVSSQGLVQGRECDSHVWGCHLRPITRGHCCPGLTTCCSEVPSSLRPWVPGQVSEGTPSPQRPAGAKHPSLHH